MTQPTWIADTSEFMRAHQACGRPLEREIRELSVTFRCSVCGANIELGVDDKILDGIEQLADWLEHDKGLDAEYVDALFAPLRTLPNGTTDLARVRDVIATIGLMIANEERDRWRHRRPK